MRISDWSSDVCSSDLCLELQFCKHARRRRDGRGIYNIVVYCAKAPAGSGRDRDRESSTRRRGRAPRFSSGRTGIGNRPGLVLDAESEEVAPGPMRPLEGLRSEEHTSEIQSLMRISYAVFCLKKKKNTVRQRKE